MGYKECFYQLKQGRAAGVDDVTLEEYEQHLDANLEDLVARMKRFSYRPPRDKAILFSDNEISAEMAESQESEEKL